VLATGALTTANQADVASFCGLHQLADGMIVAAHHYISDPDMLERLGLLAGATRSPPWAPTAAASRARGRAALAPSVVDHHG
jgi:hypothetical protein